MTLILSDGDVRQVADMPACIDAVQAALLEEAAGDIVMPPRLNLTGRGTFLRLMPVQLLASGLMGYKTFYGSMERGVRYVVALISMETGELLALVDALYLTALRTGATSGVATRFLARDEALEVAVIGSGLEARTNLAAVAAVRDVADVAVYSPRSERRARFARWVIDELGCSARARDSPLAAVERADVVIVATNTGANGPVAYQGSWMRPGQHVVSIGATSPFLRELDPAAFERADHFVVDVHIDHMLAESGDIAALVPAQFEQARRCTSLAEVVAKQGIALRDGDITLFKSVGTAAQDVAAAKAIYDAAVSAGVGMKLDGFVVPKRF